MSRTIWQPVTEPRYQCPSTWKTTLNTPCPLLLPCCDCKQLLPVTEFHPSKRGRLTITGHRVLSVCKPCSLHRYKKLDQRVKLYYGAKQRAKKINVEFAIKPNDIIIPKTCPALGLELKDYTGCGRPDFSLHHDAATLDRIDNSKGYIPSNIQVISKRANLLKKDADINELAGILAYMLATSTPDNTIAVESLTALQAALNSVTHY